MGITRSYYKVTELVFGRHQGPPEHLRWVMWLLTIFMVVKPKPVQR